MTIPSLTDSGWLPPGEHDCTVEELQDRFVPSDATRRQQIFDALVTFLGDEVALQFVDHLYIDGSFVSAKAVPGDADILVGLRPGSMQELAQQPRSEQVDMALRLTGQSKSIPVASLLHLFPYEVGSMEYDSMKRFFQRSTRDEEPNRKGILKLSSLSPGADDET